MQKRDFEVNKAARKGGFFVTDTGIFTITSLLRPTAERFPGIMCDMVKCVFPDANLTGNFAIPIHTEWFRDFFLISRMLQ